RRARLCAPRSARLAAVARRPLVGRGRAPPSASPRLQLGTSHLGLATGRVGATGERRPRWLRCALDDRPLGDPLDPGRQWLPSRVVWVSPFLLDRYEVSCGRFRAAMSDPVRPFVPPTLPSQRANAGVRSCVGTNLYRFCTWPGDAAPIGADDDAMPVNCVTHE